ncbi:2-hydroxychromene-2-carboxylate isomerase [Pseudorhodobacter sp.]|uniref:2-hydroxychromene-2-carboxylate isomerase n=1 Tax=Pseudorhodobacter sp. TaxID=1934400 RepID=UPI00264902AD|nr:2-hydroxychromene-2-carboxylate isomerase [Pseudorhodobacter sp.]MDN5788761.1 2-hydroxychromene-2-carboxylate isomerase [Pseudorhodobacter sp.]
MTGIDYYFATISPFVYLAGTRLEQIAAKHGAQITYKPVDGPTLFARMGKPAETHPARGEYAAQDRRRQARKLGLPMSDRPAFFPTNRAPSSYAVIAAQSAGGGDMGVLVHALARACWVEGRNVADDDVIRAALVEAGFDPDVADRGMLAGAEAYSANLEEAVTRGVIGVPFYIVGEQKFWGQDRLEDLDLYLGGKL